MWLNALNRLLKEKRLHSRPTTWPLTRGNSFISTSMEDSLFAQKNITLLKYIIILKIVPLYSLQQHCYRLVYFIHVPLLIFKPWRGSGQQQLGSRCEQYEI